MKRDINGILLLNKPRGISSNSALQKARALFQAKKAGHGGTLDPFASGLLPLFLGEATKFSQYMLGADKQYLVGIRFGRETTTDDCDGETLNTLPPPDLLNLDWQSVLAHFQGDYQQTPPIFSALKINGKRAYELAREGIIPEIAPRIIHIASCSVIAVNKDYAQLRIRCSKGSYIRAFARDLGRFLNSAAHAETLIREASGHFVLNQAHDLSTLETLSLSERDALLLPIEYALKNIPPLVIPEDKIRFICHGNDIAITATNGLYQLSADGHFLGIGEARDGRLYPKRLLSTEASGVF